MNPSPPHPLSGATLALATALAFGLPSLAAQAAEEKPLWEAGLGVAAVSFPAYRGSDQRSLFVLPTPYFVYRGEFLKADREGMRAELFESDLAELTVSGALSPPASSDDIRVRLGMPDLDANLEFGPQLNLKLWEAEHGSRQLKLLLPLRAAFTLNSQPKSIGWVFHPKLNLDMGSLPALPGWNVGLQAGALFGDRRQHQYFYGVDSAYATNDRPAYEARSGFAGMQYLVGVSKRFDSHWVGAFLRYDNLSGATFASSPLVRTKNYVAAGVAISWVLGQSSTRVMADE
ncbi:MipA/OmpV family protein [Hydrogenophaga sp. PAMC20947]|uniref:MipA/OmpV family protein n=1 Tax=Hydrogenophaga sp. PAMC20947 TaxID=2565558 RepID=UPI00109D9B7A|nr:MipA/OmpV family protein [Hydrogenophaga sp. PAMC20947]QCB45015.1 MipA/OmpV family protein [Hydrogenophaga sp. PAMC20947]